MSIAVKLKKVSESEQQAWKDYETTQEPKQLEKVMECIKSRTVLIEEKRVESLKILNSEETDNASKSR